MVITDRNKILLNIYYFLKTSNDFIRLDIYTENYYIALSNYYNKPTFSLYKIDSNSTDVNFLCKYLHKNRGKVVGYYFTDLYTVNNIKSIDMFKSTVLDKLPIIDNIINKDDNHNSNYKFFYEDNLPADFIIKTNATPKTEFIRDLIQIYGSNNIRFIKYFEKERKSYILYNNNLYKREKSRTNNNVNLIVKFKQNINYYKYSQIK